MIWTKDESVGGKWNSVVSLFGYIFTSELDFLLYQNSSSAGEVLVWWNSGT